GEEEEEQPEPVIPQLKAQDWVIIEIDYRLPPRPVPPYLQALYSAQATNPSAPPANAGQGAPQTGPTPSSAQAAALAAATGSQSPAAAPAGGGAPPAGAADLTDTDRARLQALMVLVRAKNPYQLSRDGALTLPGFPPIALLGLTEE